MSVSIKVVLPEFDFQKRYNVRCFHSYNQDKVYENIIQELNDTVSKEEVKQALERFIERQNFEIKSELFSQIFQYGKPLLQNFDDIARLADLEEIIKDREIPIEVLQYVFGQSSYFLKLYNLIDYFEECEIYKASTYKKFVYAYADEYSRFHDEIEPVKDYLNYESICKYLNFVKINGDYFVSDFLTFRN